MTSTGPHVTPELFAVSAGRLWCAAAAYTLKVRVIGDHAPVAVLATVGDRSAVLLGHATVFDPTTPLPMLGNVAAAAATPLATLRFASRNVAELTGAALDLVTGKMGNPLRARRVLLGIDVEAFAVLGDGIEDHGGWDLLTDDDAGPAPDPTGGRELGDGAIDTLPEALRGPAGSGAAALGWTTSGGRVVALPATWDAVAGRAQVPAALFDLVGATKSSRASITRDAWTGYGPSGKRGVLLRGRGDASAADGSSVAVDLRLERITYWDGIETATLDDPGTGSSA